MTDDGREIVLYLTSGQIERLIECCTRGGCGDLVPKMADALDREREQRKRRASETIMDVAEGGRRWPSRRVSS